MEESSTYSMFSSAVSADEWSQIPSEIAKKIQTFVVEKYEELISAKAISETNKFNAENALTEVQNQLETSESSLSENNAKLEVATRTITELESQISTCTLDITKLQTTCNKLEAEAEEFRHQRNLALGEKDELAKMLKRSSAEVERLQMEVTALTNQLQSAINAKCEALAESGELASMKLTLEYKEKRLDQERAFMKNQIETLTETCNERTEELLSLKKDSSLRCIQLENKLTEKTQELTVALESIRNLTDINNNLSTKIEELTEELKAQRDKDAKTYELYQHEMQSQIKLANLYKAASEQSKEHADQLSTALTELQNLLREATDKYGDLETKSKEYKLANEEIIEKKNEYISMLKQELETSNDVFKILKDESVQNEIEAISPAAAAASRLIKPDMSLTQICTQYANIHNELIHEREESNRLQSYLQRVVREIEEKDPLFRKQLEDYEVALETIKELTQNYELLTTECEQLREQMLKCKSEEATALRACERFKKEIADLGRQVCHLLREIELSRVGSSSVSTDQDISESISSGDIISKKFVTFNDIIEMQAINQRLLAVVRELTTKQEEAESLDPAYIAEMKCKLDLMKETQSNLLEQQESQNKMMNMLINQRDMYKNLYEQLGKGSGDDVNIQLDRSFLPDGERGSLSSKGQEGSDSTSYDKIQELETQLEKTKKEISNLKEENDVYRKEKTANEKMLLEQIEGLRKEVRELTQQNCKLSSVIEMNNERFKLMQSNLEVYKNQISALEKQNQIYSESNVKHEQIATFLKDETLQAQTKLSKAEVRLGNIEKENALLQDRETRLIKEVEFLKKESLSKNLLQTNIELIKATLERNDAESRIRLEERLDEAYRECAALRRRLQEEQDHFREIEEYLGKQTQAAQSQMEEEKNQAIKLREEIAEARDELTAKHVQLEELTKKLKNSLLVIPDNNIDKCKFREMEQMLNNSKAEVEALQQQLKTAKQHTEHLCSVSEGAEKQMKIFMEEEKKSKELLKERDQRIAKLEEKCSELQGELSIQSDDINTLDLRGKLHRLEEEFKTTKSELDEAKKDLEASQNKIKELTVDFEAAENKYTREMLLHSTDLQSLTTMKEELAQVLTEIESIKHARDQAIEALQESKDSLAIREQYFEKEKENLQDRYREIDQHNTLLLDQIQTLNNQVTLIQTQATDQLNRSVGSGESINLNRSFAEDEVKSSDQLLKIIKYLRQEKDISISKCEILEAEHLRLKSEHDLVVKQLSDAKAALETDRQKSDISIVTAAKHAEVLRKIETLNAITDSNRTLRQERDTLVEQITELKNRMVMLEDQLVPLQEKNKELSFKFDTLHSENVTLKADATRWRQRANMLIEKSNRTSPEDWKRLQSERENLAKQLTIERGTTTKLSDDLNTVRQEKTKLEEQLKNLRSQQNQMFEELERIRNELAKSKDECTSIRQDLDNLKEAYGKLNDEKSLTESQLNSKSEMVLELRNNLLAVRKIAKKYKQQCEELTQDLKETKEKYESKCENEIAIIAKQEQVLADSRSEQEERITKMEQSHNEKIDELTQQINSASEETITYKKEIESLKQTSLEKEERFKTLFKNAKERIVTLTEQNNSLRTELNINRTPDQNDVNKNLEMEKLIKEKDEIITEKLHEKERYNNEIETLMQKINQLQRQVGQQISKPTTSSGTIEKSTIEPPTANIKPMAGHSTNTQTQSIQIQPWRSGPETPLASIRPMSMQLRTVAVLPTSQGPSTSQCPSAVMVPPQQVHTTGPNNIEPLSSSPTSSHTEYMPATSSATPTVVIPRQVAVPPTQSTQDIEDDDTNMQAQPAPQQQAVALVLPRVEQPSNGPAQESGTSSSSSNTVTTTQAGLKRQREVDTDICQIDEQGKSQQQTKRSRIQQGSTETIQSHGTVTDSGLEIEYEVPTSSQRDHEEDTDAVIVVESDEDGEGPDEGEGDDDADDPDTEGYDMETYPEQELNYDDPDCQDIEEEEAGNEVEVVDDSNEVPNQSENSMQENASQEESSGQAQSETISSGTDGPSSVTVSQASPSVAVTMPSFSRTRPIAPLARQQQQGHLLLPHGIDEGGDDGIVPSTPTLFVPRRSDGFGEAVSSPHVPTSGRFTFNESASSNNSGSTEIIPEQTLEFSNTDDNSTGRSVPSTPLQTSPQESGPAGEEHNSHQNTSSETEIADITVSGARDEAESGPEGSLTECMGPPSAAGTSTEASTAEQRHEEMLDNEDGVTSEGEKPPASEESEEEGREAEASPSTNTRSRSSGSRGSSVARRSIRSTHMRGSLSRPTPTPIVWNDQHHSTRHQQSHRGGRGQTNFPRVARRSRGRSPRSPYGRF